MLPLFLSFALAAAPIPKAGAYEGSIVLLITSPEPTALVLSPYGEELKRISLKELEGTVESIRIGRDQSCLLVETIEEKTKEKKEYQQSLFWIDLREKAKPKRIIAKDNHFAWMLNRESTTIYASELNPNPNADSKVIDPQIHWQYDVKTGKSEKIDLPENYLFVDIAHADNSILATVNPSKKSPIDFKFVVLSSKDWKPTYQSPKDMTARLISPDGKSVICDELRTAANGQKQFNGMTIFNVKSTERIEFPESSPGAMALAFTFGTNNRVATVVQNYNRQTPGKSNQDVYVMSFDGTQKKKIYTNKPGERISDCDWR